MKKIWLECKVPGCRKRISVSMKTLKFLVLHAYKTEFHELYKIKIRPSLLKKHPKFFKEFLFEFGVQFEYEYEE